MNYQDKISEITDISFEEIRKISVDHIKTLSKQRHEELRLELKRGIAILNSEDQLSQYINLYGPMHQAKLKKAFTCTPFDELSNNKYEVIDWGCGQGLATVCFFDELKKRGINHKIARVTLIEPSGAALERAKIHVSAYVDSSIEVCTITKCLDEVESEEIQSHSPITIHLFSNILDVNGINLQKLSQQVGTNIKGCHYVFCISPLIPNNPRLNVFYNYFNAPETLIDKSEYKHIFDPNKKPCSYNIKVFKLENNSKNLIYVDYLPTKQSYAAYQLDGVKAAFENLSEDKRSNVNALYKNLASFEVAAPFDVSASVFDDTHPILAVLNNIVTRGLPTKASPMVEEAFKHFGNKRKEDSLGSISYSISDINVDDLFLSLHCIDSRFDLNKENYNNKALDSDLELTYITGSHAKILNQLLLPQRSLFSISKSNKHFSQRVDFACEYPYSSNLHQDRTGLIIDVKKENNHSNFDFNSLKWDYRQVVESQLDNKLGVKSDYLSNTVTAYNRTLDSDWIKHLQLTLSPIAIARVQKTIIDALLTQNLSLEDAKWHVLAIEHDVPCTAIALAELQEMFNNLVSVSKEYRELRFPEIDLTILSSDEFKSSPLHYLNEANVNVQVLEKVTPIITATTFDLVIDISVLRRAELEQIDYSNFKCNKNAYFNIRSSHYIRGERQIYTTDTIDYLPMVEKNNQGLYSNIESNCKILTYFLQLLFRKEGFRQGQLPILSRALQNQCVIGLLPTGGGKSLTYQLAAMLQPGVTIIIDPLRALMKDQYDGLINIGIDTCTFINSTINAEEKTVRAHLMENSQYQFVFLSPERLSIQSFRERLRNMQELGVYFSYGVIDEVHCVSEWGHDFRFSYLHLGRNLYKYVLPKNAPSGKSVTLFGLTATASFDVLADVERELSGEGTFNLDSDTIVRDENTNRLELQYRIEKVPIEYTDDEHYNKYNKIDKSLPRAVKMTDKKSIYESKKNYISNYIKQIPTLINELQEEESLKIITSRYYDRQNIELSNPLNLNIYMPQDFASTKDVYNQAGIVFCPHKDKTGISVTENARSLNNNITDIGTFMGSNENDNNNDADNQSFKNLEKFRDNKLPIMVATKAFGMGIDKPNVRFTINMNYSSSLESFVQEAGRAGRDRKMALSTILMSDYTLERINKKYSGTQTPLSTIKNKWFKKGDLQQILDHYKISIENEYIDTCTPQVDMAKLKCVVCNIRFGFDLCDKICTNCNKGPCIERCNKYETCQLRRVSRDIKSQYIYISDLKESLRKDNIKLERDNFEYQNFDYETVMYFYNNNFKGSTIEKQIIHELLSKSQTGFSNSENKLYKQTNQFSNFLTQLLNTKPGETLKADVSTKNIYSYRLEDIKKRVEVIQRYSQDNSIKIKILENGEERIINKNELIIDRESSDIAKAIYRMCCIGLIDDFTQDYTRNLYQVVATRKKDGEYYKALKKFLERYYTKDRAALEIKKVPEYKGENEIHKCLGYLTEFIYEKIAKKRKQAIDDMRSFCMIGLDETKDWKERNEELKDYIYYYFNSKFARKGFEINNEPFSLTDDTEEGKISSFDILFKFLRVIDYDIVDTSTPIDNIKHLLGAVRLIRKATTDSNPTLDLLNVFCLLYLKVGENQNLQIELKNSFMNGYLEFYNRTENKELFYENVNKFKTALIDNNRAVATKAEINQLDEWGALCELNIHTQWLEKFTENYTK